MRTGKGIIITLGKYQAKVGYLRRHLQFYCTEITIKITRIDKKTTTWKLPMAIVRTSTHLVQKIVKLFLALVAWYPVKLLSLERPGEQA